MEFRKLNSDKLSSLSVKERQLLIVALLYEANFFSLKIADKFFRERIVRHLRDEYPVLFYPLDGADKVSKFVETLIAKAEKLFVENYERSLKKEAERLIAKYEFRETVQVNFEELLVRVQKDANDKGILSEIAWLSIQFYFGIDQSESSTYEKKLNEHGFFIDRTDEDPYSPEDTSEVNEKELLTHDEMMVLFTRMNTEGKESREVFLSIRNELVEHNLKLVDFVLERMTIGANYSARRSREDDRQQGMIALMYAVEKFDHTRGIKFSTYAYRSIKNAIRRNRHANVSDLKLSENRASMYQRVIQLRNDWERAHQKEIDLETWAKIADMDVKLLRRLLRAHRPAQLIS